jgi:hypothetical protein
MPALDEVTGRGKCALLFLSAAGHFIGDPTVEAARRFPVMVQAMQREL